MPCCLVTERVERHSAPRPMLAFFVARKRSSVSGGSGSISVGVFFALFSVDLIRLSEDKSARRHLACYLA
jgi:hypothetical protein